MLREDLGKLELPMEEGGTGRRAAVIIEIQAGGFLVRIDPVRFFEDPEQRVPRFQVVAREFP